MHAKMEMLPTIRVGLHGRRYCRLEIDRSLQAAVDYVAALGGGVVEIGPGEYLMRDSLHLRPGVIVRGLARPDGSPQGRGGDSPPWPWMGILARSRSRSPTRRDPRSAVEWRSGTASQRLSRYRCPDYRAPAPHPGVGRALNADRTVGGRRGKAATVFPVVSGYDLEGVRVEKFVVVDGNRAHNPPMDGCRAGGIYLYRGFGTVIEHCTVRSFNGDGISFQQSNDVLARRWRQRGQRGPGSASGQRVQRATVRGCVARNNGADGLFLCWRVRHGLFEENVLDNNGRYGISIGHKDTDNLLLQQPGPQQCRGRCLFSK